MDYTDVATVEAYGGFTNPSEDERALLAHFITVASAMIDSYCGRVFAIETDAATTTKTFTQENGLLPGYDRDDQRVLWLDDDLCSTPTIATAAVGVTFTYLPDHTPYYAIKRSEGVWEDPTTVAGHWAYAMTTPPVIENVCARLVTWLYHQRESVMSQGQTVNIPNRMPSDVAYALAPYRRIRLP